MPNTRYGVDEAATAIAANFNAKGVILLMFDGAKGNRSRTVVEPDHTVEWCNETPTLLREHAVNVGRLAKEPGLYRAELALITPRPPALLLFVLGGSRGTGVSALVRTDWIGQWCKLAPIYLRLLADDIEKGAAAGALKKAARVGDA